MAGIAIELEPARHAPRGLFAMARLLLGLCCLVAVSACATLPDSGHERSVAPATWLEFETARGAVSAARSDAIIDRLEGGDGASDVLDHHLAYEQAVNADSPLVLGNKLTLLRNGPETYDAMFSAMRMARHHINLQTFIFADDEIGQRFSDLLLERQHAGVQVNVIYDAVGGLLTPPAFFERLRAGGIRVVEFNPLNPLTRNTRPWLLNNRDHRKLLVVDGRIAFTGGINISSTYSSAPSSHIKQRKSDLPIDATQGWRDTHIRIEGPVVAEFQKLFVETWVKQRGEGLAAKHYFPALKAQGNEIVRAIGSTPDDVDSLIYLTLMSAIAHAEQTVHLTIAYFAPDPQLLRALTDAARRGVDVKLILPSQTDSWAVFHLGRAHYSELLRGGVRIYERQGAVLHAKTASIDGVWSTIGSTNLDWRSFLHNDEINAVIVGRDFAAQMARMFADDLARSEAIELKRWQRRSLLLRVQEQFARLGAYWL